MKIDREQQETQGEHPEAQDRQKAQEAADAEGNTQNDAERARGRHFDGKAPDVDSVGVAPVVVGMGLVQ